MGMARRVRRRRRGRRRRRIEAMDDPIGWRRRQRRRDDARAARRDAVRRSRRDAGIPPLDARYLRDDLPRAPAGVRRMSAPLIDWPLEGTHRIEASAGTGKTFALALLHTRLVVERAL